MITYVICDLFLSPAHVLVNTVNTVGVMGKGIAKDFKRIYPDMFSQYQELCEKGSLDIGNLWLYRTTNKWVLNFPTKRHWRQPSRPEYIEAGLKKFVETYHVHGITSISFPLLGCGNGELDWESQVRPLMERYLGGLPINIFIHRLDRQDPFRPEHKSVKKMQDWLRQEPESLAFAEVWDDLKGLLRSPMEFSCLDIEDKFKASIGADAEGITLEVDGATVVLPSDAILDLWQMIRQAGFVAGENLPNGLDTYASYVVPVMTALPYVEPVMMAAGHKEAGKLLLGMRLAARPRVAQLPLLDLVGAVEPE